MIDAFFGGRINRHLIVAIEKRPNQVLRGGLVGFLSRLALGLRFQEFAHRRKFGDEVRVMIWRSFLGVALDLTEALHMSCRRPETFRLMKSRLTTFHLHCCFGCNIFILLHDGFLTQFKWSAAKVIILLDKRVNQGAVLRCAWVRLDEG